MGVSERNCKQMETLRILGERSRDGSADIRMSAISIWLPMGPFPRQGKGNGGRLPRGEKSLLVPDAFSSSDGFLHMLYMSDQAGQPLRRGYT